MAKTKASSTAAKAHQGKTSAKPAREAGKSKAGASRERIVKSARTSSARTVARPGAGATAKKVAPKSAIARKPASGKAPEKAPVKKAAAGKVGPRKPAPAGPVVKKAAPGPGAARKPAVKPAASGHKAAATHVAPPRPTAAASHPAPSPASKLFKGKVASATAMVAPKAGHAAGRHVSSPKSSKNSSSPMNKLATRSSDNGVTREDGRYALPATSTITLPKGYRPSSHEEYMNPRHLAYFRNKLRDWRDQLVEESRQTMDNLREEVRDVGDEAERATRETENSLELRTRDRYRKLIAKIDKALRRIEEGSYGFCEETDEEIGIDRLDARPIATLSLDAQERREHLQKQMGD